MKSLECVIIDLALQLVSIVRDIDWQFAASCFKGYYNRNFFDWGRQNSLKKWNFSKNRN